MLCNVQLWCACLLTVLQQRRQGQLQPRSRSWTKAWWQICHSSSRYGSQQCKRAEAIRLCQTAGAVASSMLQMCSSTARCAFACCACGCLVWGLRQSVEASRLHCCGQQGVGTLKRLLRMCSKCSSVTRCGSRRNVHHACSSRCRLSLAAWVMLLLLGGIKTAV